jgi:hypothetical protein
MTTTVIPTVAGAAGGDDSGRALGVVSAYVVSSASKLVPVATAAAVQPETETRTYAAHHGTRATERRETVT